MVPPLHCFPLHPPLRCSHKNKFLFGRLNFIFFFGIPRNIWFYFHVVFRFVFVFFFLITSDVLTGESHHAAFLWVAGHSSSHPKFLTLLFFGHKTVTVLHSSITGATTNFFHQQKTPHLSSSLICYFNLKTRTENITGWRNKKW